MMQVRFLLVGRDLVKWVRFPLLDIGNVGLYYPGSLREHSA
jgi:hypothetical protein